MSKRRAAHRESTAPMSFIVPMWAVIFRILGLLSFLRLLRWLIPWLRSRERSYAVIEAWVIIHSAIALATALGAYSGATGPALRGMLIYGGIRILEIVVIQTNILLFDEWRARRRHQGYSLRGYRRSLILLLHNYAEVIFWFVAAFFAFNSWSWLVLENASFGGTFRATLLSMVAFSTEGVRPLGRFADFLLTVQSLVGVFMTVLALARFLSLMPTPTTQEPTERQQ